MRGGRGHPPTHWWSQKSGVGGEFGKIRLGGASEQKQQFRSKKPKVEALPNRLMPKNPEPLRNVARLAETHTTFGKLRRSVHFKKKLVYPLQMLQKIDPSRPRAIPEPSPSRPRAVPEPSRAIPEPSPSRPRAVPEPCPSRARAAPATFSVFLAIFVSF